MRKNALEHAFNVLKYEAVAIQIRFQARWCYGGMETISNEISTVTCTALRCTTRLSGFARDKETLTSDEINNCKKATEISFSLFAGTNACVRGGGGVEGVRR